MLDTLTYIFDKGRITILGDSECPLKKRCDKYNLGYDKDSLPCVSTRGRIDTGERAPCYGSVKQQIRSQKKSLAERLSEGIMGSCTKIGGKT